MLCVISFFVLSMRIPETVYGAQYNFIVLSDYKKTVDIGEEFYLIAITSNGKKPSFSSSDSKVASVNTYGKITAKKAGTANIKVKIKNAEVICKVTVRKTIVTLSQKNIVLENGYKAKLKVKSSTNHKPSFKSSKKSIAEVDENGNILAKKPGTATIKVTVDGTTENCSVKVKIPTVTISHSIITLYRTNTYKIYAKSTSKSEIKWKSNKSSVAIVDNEGNVTAIKHGEAMITVTSDGMKKTCRVIVKQPVITMDIGECTLKKGKSKTVTAEVSSGVKPLFYSSNTSVARVDDNGKITAVSKGKAYIYATEDGVKAKTRVIVIE